MTIAELAGRVGIQPGPLGNIERGQNGPSARVVQRLCQVLEVPATAIFTEDPKARPRLRDPDSAYRIDAEEEPLSATLEARLEQLIDEVHALEDVVGAQKHSNIPLHIPINPNDAGIRDLARRARTFMQIGHGIQFDYFELFEAQGFRVLVLDLPDEIESVAHYDPACYNAFFFINARKNPEKQIFRLVYELGRVFLHHQRSIPAVRLAKQFAAEFLMPPAAIEATVKQLGLAGGWSYELLLRIKHRFGVSAESFAIRLSELSYISVDEKDTFVERIKRHYDEDNFAEPGGGKRMLTPNGRIGDLLLAASALPESHGYPGLKGLLRI